MVLFDMMIVNVVLLIICISLKVDEVMFLWIILGYVFVYGLVFIFVGWIGDCVGYKWVFIVGFIGFMLVSVVVGFVNDLVMFIVVCVV